MRSPFPGMNPYLETAALWSAVHNRLIAAIADELVEHLSLTYRVEIETRTYLETDEGSVLVGLPDVAVVTRSKQTTTENLTATQPSSPPETVTLPMVEAVREWYLEIREVATGTVVTAIEILSPSNKRPGEGRRVYERKRNQIFASLTHLVEIDLLRSGQPLSPIEQQRQDYRILVSRSDRRPTAQIYAFNLKEPIPAIPIPLFSDEPEPLLHLQPLLQRVYEKGRYHLAIDYQQPPQPPLAESDRAWAEALCQDLESPDADSSR